MCVCVSVTLLGLSGVCMVCVCVCNIAGAFRRVYGVCVCDIRGSPAHVCACVRATLHAWRNCAHTCIQVHAGGVLCSHCLRARPCARALFLHRPVPGHRRGEDFQCARAQGAGFEMRRCAVACVCMLTHSAPFASVCTGVGRGLRDAGWRAAAAGGEGLGLQRPVPAVPAAQPQWTLCDSLRRRRVRRVHRPGVEEQKLWPGAHAARTSCTPPWHGGTKALARCACSAVQQGQAGALAVQCSAAGPRGRVCTLPPARACTYSVRLHVRSARKRFAMLLPTLGHWWRA